MTNSFSHAWANVFLPFFTLALLLLSADKTVAQVQTSNGHTASVRHSVNVKGARDFFLALEYEESDNLIKSPKILMYIDFVAKKEALGGATYPVHFICKFGYDRIMACRVNAYKSDISDSYYLNTMAFSLTEADIEKLVSCDVSKLTIVSTDSLKPIILETDRFTHTLKKAYNSLKEEKEHVVSSYIL